jgi:PAS domain S-box-containing protein
MQTGKVGAEAPASAVLFVSFVWFVLEFSGVEPGSGGQGFARPIPTPSSRPANSKAQALSPSPDSMSGSSLCFAGARSTVPVLWGRESMSIWDWLFNPSGLTAHGFCLSWAPGLVGLHVASDAIIGLSYFSIPLAIAAFVSRRPDIRYSWVAYLFVAFILACGTTHFFSVFTLWVPVYGLEGVVKAITAVLSIATAALLWPLIPKIAALPTITELEQRVAERTAELSEANARLTRALEERTRAEAAAAASEAQYRASFEHAAVGKAQFDPATHDIIRANAALARMLGYEPEELAGRRGWDFVWPEDRDLDRQAWDKVLAGEIDTFTSEKRYLRKDGTPVWGRVSTAAVRDPQTGAPTIAISVIEDIDERYKSQADLAAANQALQAMVAERTAALAQRDLLLREVYHRVKNNLQIVDSLLVMQARQVSDPDSKAALMGLRSRVYALGLVHHQLMGSPDLQTFDFAPFLKELSANILEGGATRGVTLDVHAEPLTVGLDFAIPLGLLVTELVTNSLKHAFPDGEGRINVELSRDEDGSVSLVVADNGQGMAAGQVAGESGKSPSRGLGANIIKGLVAQLRGTMSVREDNGTRSEVRVTAPVLA